MTRRTKRGAEHVLDVWGTHLHLCTNREELAALIRVIDSLDAAEVTGSLASTTGVLEHHDDGSTTYHLVFWLDRLCFDPTGRPELLANTAAHEAVHGAHNILQHHDRNSPPSTDGETFAYLVGWLAEWIYSNTA